MTGLILKETGWCLITEVPEEPKYTDTHYYWQARKAKRDYDQAIQQAISSAIPVQNQGVAKELWNPHPEEHRFEPGKIYPVEVRYEIRYQTHEGVSIVRGSAYKKEGESEIKQAVKVAILLPPEQDKSEVIRKAALDAYNSQCPAVAKTYELSWSVWRTAFELGYQARIAELEDKLKNQRF